MRSKVLTTSLFAGALSIAPGLAWAAPEPWQTGLQAAASPVMERVTDFHDLLLWIISAIVLFVFALIAYACWKFNETRNPVPSRRSHHTLLEIAWTAIPVLILVVIAIPSFKLLYYMDVVPETEMTIKATGYQWYWNYEYPDNGNFTFDAYMVAESDLQPGQLRLLTADNRVVVPIGTNIRVQTTGGDVLHSWAMPQLGVKVDAIPGRLNELWINVEKPGMYYGQCSELCGINHAFMPIMLEAKTKTDFDAWVKEAQSQFAKVGDDGAVRVASTPRPAN